MPAPTHAGPPDDSWPRRIRSAVLWRSGSQVAAQIVQWGSTSLVIRLLDPADYGLFAMTQVVLVFLNMLNGYGLAGALVREPEVSERQVRQVMALLLLLNGGLALTQLLLAPLAAAYYRQPMVADLLRVQALLYLATPFVALPAALLSRRMAYRGQASANLAASAAGAATALAGALAGWGVWTLVAAPAAIFGARAVLTSRAAGPVVRPLFDFRGAGHLVRYGGVAAAAQLFWFAQSQADVLIAGRVLPVRELGLYTTAVFLAQVFVAKAVPPLNEVAFAAYARLAADRDPDRLGRAFLRGAESVAAAAFPFYLGLAATAEPLVLTVLGSKWAGAAPVVRVLALAMPVMTVQVLLRPACDARGRPGIGVVNGAWGALVLGTAFLMGVRWGPVGLAWAWVAAYPLYLALSLRRALPVIGVSAASLGRALAPPLSASIAMAALVVTTDGAVGPLPPAPRLALLVFAGAVAYVGWLALFGRPLLRRLGALARGQADWI